VEYDVAWGLPPQPDVSAFENAMLAGVRVA